MEQIRLYQISYAKLFGICMRYKTNKQDADAIFNIAFLKILDNLKRLKSEVAYFPWAKKVLINTLIDEYRKSKKRTEIEEYAENATLLSMSAGMNWNEGALQMEAEEIRNMIMNLPKMSRVVFNMFAIDGFSHREIADQLNISEGTSKWHVSSARSRIQKQILQRNPSYKMIKNG